MNTDTENTHRHTSKLQARIDHHVNLLVRQHKRFEHLADQVDRWAERWSTDALRRRLHLAESTEVREKALVALALQATGAARMVIDNYIPTDGDEDHDLFHQVVCVEWERRHDADTPPLAA